MTRRPLVSEPRHLKPLNRIPSQSRIDRLVEIIDHCSAAKQGADEMGDKFLSYLLSMAIQEARALARNPSTSSNS